MHHGLGHDVGTLTNEAFRLRCVMTQCKAFGVSWTFQTKTKSDIALGNRLALWTASIIRLAIRYRVPITIENPMTSRLWIFPPIAKEVSRATSVIVFDACQYGTPWKKSTKLASWNIDLSPLEKRCHQTANCCSATGVPHVKLEGVDDKGEFWTAKASPYPLPFCRAFAHLLTAENVITQSP